MRFQSPLMPARLIRRYKRFLADCRLADGSEITAHMANPGSMMGLAGEGAALWLEPNDDPKRKLKFTVRLVETEGGALVCVDTGMANRVIKEALAAEQIPAFAKAGYMRPEMPFGDNSRVDFHFAADRDTYLEVKSVTLSRSPGLAEFPDSVTARGTRHLRDLEAEVARGHRAAMLYVIMRSDCDRLSLAADLDPAYAQAFQTARKAGVEAHVIRARITPEAITLGDPGSLVDPV